MNTSEHAVVINAYLDEVKEKYYSGIAIEHAYRPALQRLIEGLCPSVNAINDAKRLEVGAPDFVLTQRKDSAHQMELLQSIPLGFVEAKDIKLGILDKPENKSQLERYMQLGNVVHTDSLTFRFYFEKELVKEVVLGHVNSANHIVTNDSDFSELVFYFQQTIARHGRTIRTAKSLALHMADRARQIRHTILAALQQDIENGNSTELSQQYEAFRKTLIHDLTPDGFADIYAETIAYGLFAARYHDNTPDDFSIREAAEKLPKTNPFLHKFFLQIAAYEKEDRLNWVLENFAELFNHADVQTIMSTHGVKTAMNHDPVIHFYETFLGEYDAKRRKARGVYYTPLPVVQFIVRAVDDVLKKEFGLAQGLADDSTVKFTENIGQEVQSRAADGKIRKMTQRIYDIPRVQVLDPATGTGTFLNEIIKHIYEVKGKNIGAGWSDYVEKNLLPRLHGFELLMAAYAMAHMRLGMTLNETGYKPSKNPPRLGVYLTNTLEEPSKQENDMFGLFGMARTLSEESHEADRIKRDQPIMVVIGNPPYSVSSSNKSEFIEKLTADYKKDLNERNIQPLSDDYIKFIRYAEHMIEKNGQGIVAMITNNSYFDGLIHRQMRKHLLETFDKIYVLDLHGNSKKKEVSKGGLPDENVFDIQQGVGITIGIKNGSKRLGELAEVHRLSTLSTRKDKYDMLRTWGLDMFADLKIYEPKYTFDMVDTQLRSEWEDFIGIRELMPFGDTGVKTHRDSFVVDMEENSLRERMREFYVLPVSEVRAKYSLKDNRDFLAATSRQSSEYDENNIVPYAYRPFDTQFAYYSKWLVDWPRENTMRHMKAHNYALIVVKQPQAANLEMFDCAFIADKVTDVNFYRRGGPSVLPLYRYESDGIHANLAEAPLKVLLENLEPYCYVDREEDLGSSVPDLIITAIDVFDYIYASLHSPAYRIKFKEFLMSDFARIPKPTGHEQFWRLAELGGKLRQLHLMDAAVVGDAPYPFSGEGNSIVEKPRFDAGKVFINATQYFDNIPETAWNFYIGGYQPAQKWLKDRKTRALGYKDIEHYQQIIKILSETDRIMKEID